MNALLPPSHGHAFPLFIAGPPSRAGGLMSYSPEPGEAWEQVAIYVDKILHGASAGSLPITQTSQFLLTVNLKAAHALKARIPESILVRANEVIQ
ncbi:MAG: ABC transporter substrate binding protein [Betaproteobacteria bacterium]